MDFESFFSGQVTQFWDWNDLKTRFVPQPPLYAHQNLKRAGCKIHSKTRSLALGPLFDYMECKNHRAGVVRLNLGQSLLSNVYMCTCVHVGARTLVRVCTSSRVHEFACARVRVCTNACGRNQFQRWSIFDGSYSWCLPLSFHPWKKHYWKHFKHFSSHSCH